VTYKFASLASADTSAAFSFDVATRRCEGGQGARTELSQAAAEELRVPLSQIQLVMADTSLVPDDGITAGSGSTPRTVPAVRQGAAAARDLLIDFACKSWSVDRNAVQLNNGKVTDSAGQRTLTYADLAANEEASKALQQPISSDVTMTPIKEWKLLGNPAARPNGRDIVTGAHKYPSDTIRPGMLYGKVLRAPSYGAKLTSVDLGPAKAMKDVVAVQDGQFVGVAAPTAFLAEQARAAIAKTAKWELTPHPASKGLFDYLKQHAQDHQPANPFADELAKAEGALTCCSLLLRE